MSNSCFLVDIDTILLNFMFCFLIDIHPIFSTKFPLHVLLKDIDPMFKIYYNKSISCLSEDIESTCRIFKHILNGSSGFVGTLFFPNPPFAMSNILRFPNIRFCKIGSDFLDFVEVSWWVQNQK